MKKIYLFLVLLLTSITAFAQAPTFTAEGADEANSTYYYIQYGTGNLVLGTLDYALNFPGDKAVRLAEASDVDAEKEAQLWKLVGTAESLKLINKRGKALKMDRGRYRESEIADGTSFVLFDCGNGKFAFENLSNRGKGINAWSGVENGHSFGEYDKNDGGSQSLLIKESDATYPAPSQTALRFVASKDDNSSLYRIRFERGGAYLSSRVALGNEHARLDLQNDEDAELRDAQLFKLVGTADDFELYAEDGKHLVFVGDRLDVSEDDSQHTKFRVKEYKHDNYAVLVVKDKNSALNQWGKTGTGVTLGVWGIDDGSNLVRLIANNPNSKCGNVWPKVETHEEYKPTAKKWYRLIFNNNKSFVLGAGENGNKIKCTAKIEDINDPAIDAQLWQVVGEKVDDYTPVLLVNKKGQYITRDGNNYTATDVAPTDKNYFLGRYATDRNSKGFVVANYGLSNDYYSYVDRNQVVNPPGGIGEKEVGTWAYTDGNSQVILEEVKYPCTVTATATGSGVAEDFTLEGVENGTVLAGSQVSLKVKRNANASYFIKSIKVNGTEIEDDVILKTEFTKELTIEEDTNIEVEFFFAPLIAIKGVDEYAEVENGSVVLKNVQPTAGSDFVAKPNAEVLVTATPDAGYELDKVFLQTTDTNFDSQKEDITADMKFTVGEGTTDSGESFWKNDYKVLVTFKKIPVNKTLTIEKVGTGDYEVYTVDDQGVETLLAGSGDTFTVLEGTKVYIKPNIRSDKTTATAKVKEPASDLTFDNSFKGYEYVVGADATIVLNYEEDAKTAVDQVARLSMSVYPNPATEYVIVKGLSAQAQVRIISITGQTVRVAKAGFDGMIKINVENLAKGLYIVRSGKAVAKLQVR